MVVDLPAPDAPDEGNGLAGSHGEREALEHVDVGVGVDREPGVLLHRRHRSLARRWVTEHDIVELDRPDRVDQVDGPRPLLDRFGRVEHLEHPLEADHRRHQVDTGVREPRERLVDPRDECGEGDQRAGRDATVDHHDRPDAVDGRRAEGAHQTECHEEHPPVEGGADAGVADTVGVEFERCLLPLAGTEQLDQRRARHVEPLGHLRVHRRVVRHLLAGDSLQPHADAAGRNDEDGQHDQRQERELPLQGDHGRQRGDEHDDVAHHAAERAGDRGLGADDVVVEP